VRPLLLDLFCCAGGAGMGYRRAGFDVIGVDVTDQPNYAPGPFVRGDALAVLDALLHGLGVKVPGRRPVYARELAAVHASPPCQAHTALTKGNRGRNGWEDAHVDLVPPTRARLDRLGLPYVIENVQGSPVRRDLVLCGLHFGLRVFRHRYFELGGGWSMDPLTCNGRSDHAGHRVAGWRHGVKYAGDMVAVYGDGGGKGSVAEWQAAMGIDWTADRRELAEAIPPAYTQHIGRGLLAALGRQENAA